MVTVRPVARPILALVIFGFALLLLLAYEVGFAGVGPRPLNPPSRGAPVTTTGPEDAGPGVVSQSPPAYQSTSCGPHPCKPAPSASANGGQTPAQTTSGGPEDAGPGVVFQGQSYSSTGCGPRPCKP
jgi:hypothetical protein